MCTCIAISIHEYRRHACMRYSESICDHLGLGKLTCTCIAASLRASTSCMHA